MFDNPCRVNRKPNQNSFFRSENFGGESSFIFCGPVKFIFFPCYPCQWYNILKNVFLFICSLGEKFRVRKSFYGKVNVCKQITS